MSSIAHAFGLAISYKFASKSNVALVRAAAEAINAEAPGCRAFGSFMRGMFLGRKLTQKIEKEYARDTALVVLSSTEEGYHDRKYYGIGVDTLTDKRLEYANKVEFVGCHATII